MNESNKKKALADAEGIAREVAASLGLEVVEFVFHSQGRHSQLRIDVDRPGLPGVGLADCERMSRAVGDQLESLPLFDSPYELQVSSPGIDRPIRSDDDIRRNTGRPVRVEFRDELGKVREIVGTLAGTSGPGAVRVASGPSETTVTRDRIVLMKQVVAPGGRRRNET